MLTAACILMISLHEALIGSPVLAQEGTLVRAEYNDCTILQVHFVVEDCDDLSDGLILWLRSCAQPLEYTLGKWPFFDG